LDYFSDVGFGRSCDLEVEVIDVFNR
jgi:hypothetical protein